MSKKESNEITSMIKFDVWAIVSDLIERVPGLLIDREAFLRSTFSKTLTTEELENLIYNGAYKDIDIAVINDAADKCISKTRLITTGASFLTGLPSSLPALPATITADVSQSFAFYLRTSQELAYLYGETDDFTKMPKDDKMTKFLLYIGAMFGVDMAGKVLILMSENAGIILAKKFSAVAVTQVLGGVPWRVAKAIAALLGIKLTKEVAAKGIAKVLPVLGGVASGALTYTFFGVMAKRLKKALHDSFVASSDEIEELFEELSQKDNDEIIYAISEDIVEGIVSDMEKLDM